MASFPLTLDNILFSFKSSTLKPVNKQTSSSGYTMGFPKGTITKKIFNFTLSNLSNTNRETLETFFDTNQGISFTIDFTCTGDSTTYNVIFDQDSLDFERDRTFNESDGTYTLSIKVKEV